MNLSQAGHSSSEGISNGCADSWTGGGGGILFSLAQNEDCQVSMAAGKADQLPTFLQFFRFDK